MFDVDSFIVINIGIVSIQIVINFQIFSDPVSRLVEQRTGTRKMDAVSMACPLSD